MARFLLVLIPLALVGAAAAGAQEAANTRPPPIVLVSKAGTQRAVQESYCVSVTTAEGGVTGCGDSGDWPPDRLSVVRPREQVAIVVRGATVARGVVTVHPLGKERVVLKFRLRGPKTRWRVSLRPRAYEVQVSVSHFETRDGRSGDTAATLGILVDRKRKLRIIPAEAGTRLAG